MTPGARVHSAIEILDRILAGAPAEQTLTNWARSNRFAGSKDRAAIRDHVFGVLRRKRSLAAMSGQMTGRGLMIAAIADDKLDLDELFSGVGYSPSVLSAAERSQLVGFDDLDGDEQSDLPQWIWELLCSDHGENAKKIAATLRTRAGVFLRVNVRKASVQTAIEALAQDGIGAISHPLATHAIEVTGNARRVVQSQAFKQGLVELQDAGSQAIIEFLELPQKGAILDYCSGGGGKSLAMAAVSDAQVYAHDIDPGRMSDIPSRAERAGVSIEQFKKTIFTTLQR